MFATSNRIVAQDSVSQKDENQSNGVFEMLAVYIPYFVAFSRVADKKISQVEAYLVSGIRRFKTAFEAYSEYRC